MKNMKERKKEKKELFLSLKVRENANKRQNGGKQEKRTNKRKKNEAIK